MQEYDIRTFVCSFVYLSMVTPHDLSPTIGLPNSYSLPFARSLMTDNDPISP